MSGQYKVNREELLRVLKAAEPGLSAKGILEQSDAYCFSNGYVVTFNDEVSVRAKTGLPKELVGAVKAKPLTAMLEKLPEDDITLEVQGGELIVSGKRRQTGLTLQAEIVLPVEGVEKPTEWKPLHAEFCEAVQTVGKCAAQTTQQSETAVFVHLSSKWAESSDGFQLCRWPFDTQVKTSICIRAASILPATHLGLTDLCETGSWLHLRAKGIVYSVRRFLEDYPDMTKFLDVAKGSPAVLPKGLADACERAMVLVGENPEEDRRVEVDLQPGRVRLRGVGISGWYKETKRVTGYEGKPVKFMVSPQMLIDLVRNHSECTVAENRLSVDAGKFKWLAWLFKADAVVEPEAEEGESDGNED